MGLPVPTYMDGTVLEQAFTDDFNESNPIHNHDGGWGPLVEDVGYADDEEKAVLAKLRDMGYTA
jgi:hypothetical protein